MLLCLFMLVASNLAVFNKSQKKLAQDNNPIALAQSQGVKETRAEFNRIDSNNDGVITKEELRVGMPYLNDKDLDE